MSTGRLEAFSDGVIAVAITLLVLDLRVPPIGSGSLATELAQEWPQYVAYATSFITIGIIWINHHAAISRLREADHTLMILNLLLLMWVAVIPFGTSLMAKYLQQGQGEHLAATIYGAVLLGMGLTFAALNRHILRVKPEMMHTEIAAAERARLLQRSVVGVAPYAVATALAPVSPYATLAICAALALYYALPASRT